MQLDDALAAGALVQAVDVLRGEQEGGDAALERRERVVAGIGRDAADHLAAHRVPVPHALRIARERARRGELARVELRPQAPLRIAERRHAGLGGHAGAGEHGDEARGAQRAGERDGNRG